MGRIARMITVFFAPVFTACDLTLPTTGEEKEEYRFIVLADTAAVSGEPGFGVMSYPAGERVDYQFEARGDHWDEIVVLDGVLAPSSGTIEINNDHLIIAGAFPKQDLYSEDFDAVSAGFSVLSSFDRLGAYRHYIDELTEIYDNFSGEEARARASAIVDRAFGGASDQQLLEAKKELGGRTYDFGFVEPGLSAASGAFGESSLGSFSNIQVVLVTGLWTRIDEATHAELELREILKEAHLPARIGTELFYSKSEFKNPELPAYCALRGLSALKFGPKTAIAKFLGCFGSAGISEIGKATEVMLSLLGELDVGAKEDAVLLAERLHELLAADKDVILLGHSYGSMVAAHALNLLGEFSSCIVGVSLGGPLGEESWGLPPSSISGFTVKGSRAGDFVLRLGLNYFPQVQTNISQSADGIVTLYEQSMSSIADTIYFEVLKTAQDIRLHSLVGSYFLGDRSRQRVKELIGAHIETLQSREECTVPTFPAGSRTSLFAIGSEQTGFGRHEYSLWRIEPWVFGKDQKIGPLRATHLGDETPIIDDITLLPEGELWGVRSDALWKIDTLTAEIDTVVLFHQGERSRPHVTSIAANTDTSSTDHGLFYGLERSDISITNILRMDKTGYWVRSARISPHYSAEPVLGFFNALAFNPQNNRIYAAVEGPRENFLATINRSNWDTSVTPFSLGRNPIRGLVFAGDKLFVFSELGANAGLLYELDLRTGKLTEVKRLPFRPRGAG